MLQVHNSKVDKIRKGYGEYCSLRQQALEEGVTLEELQEKKALFGNGDASKKAKTARPGLKKTLIVVAKKKFAAKNKDVEVLIKVKDEEGKIV